MDNITPLTVVQQTAVELFKNQLTPLAIQAGIKKPKGNDGHGTGWSSMSYESEAAVIAAFAPQDNIGLLLNEETVVFDIDDPAVANDYGREILKLHLIPTDTNCMGRQKKPIGAIIFSSDANSPYFEIKDKDGNEIIELLVKGKQKVLPPSIFSDEQFEWKPQKSFNPVFKYVPYDELKAAAIHVAIFSLLSNAYPAPDSGNRDNACYCILRLLANAPDKSVINAEYADGFIKLLAKKAGDEERYRKNWHKHFEKSKETYDCKGQLKKHIPTLHEENAAIVSKLLGYDDREEAEPDIDLDSMPSLAELTEAGAVARDWCIKNFAQRGTYSQIHGAGGVGKSIIGILTAILATQKGSYLCDLFQFEKNCKVAVFNNEDSQEELDRRSLAIFKGLQSDPNNKRHQFDRSKVIVKSFLKSPLKFLDKDNRGKLKPRLKTIATIQKWLADNEIDVLILDPIISFHNAEENSNADMDMFIRECVIAPFAAQSNTAVIGIHHVAKGTSNNSMDIEGNTNAARGASAVTNAARSVIRLAGMNLTTAQGVWTDYKKNPELLDQRHDYTQIAFGKVNNSRATDGNWLRKDVVQFRNSKNQLIDSVYLRRDYYIEGMVEEAETAKKKADEKLRAKVIQTLIDVDEVDLGAEEQYWQMVDVARILAEHNDEYVKEISFVAKTGSEDYRKDEKQIANHLVALFKSGAYEYEDKQFTYENKKRVSGNSKRWLAMTTTIPKTTDADIKAAAAATAVITARAEEDADIDCGLDHLENGL